MSYRHAVTDSTGKVHKRISAGRQYAFAVVVRFPEYIHNSAGRIPARHYAVWASRRDLAEKAAATQRSNWSQADMTTEIIPCTPEEV